MSAPLCSIAELVEDKWLAFSLPKSNDSFMVKKLADEVYVYHNFCPHQGRRLDYAPGEFLETPDKQVVCPAHGATFKTKDGFCTGGPCAGDSLKAVTVTIKDDMVYIDVD